MKDIDLFSDKYHLYEGYSLCTISNQKNEYFSQNIEIAENYIKFIFVNFEMTDKNDTEVDDRLDEERMCFNKKIKYNNEIIKFLLSDQKVFGKNYELKAIINTPRIDHYNSIIIKLNKLCYNLELGNT